MKCANCGHYELAHDLVAGVCLGPPPEGQDQTKLCSCRAFVGPVHTVIITQEGEDDLERDRRLR